MQKSRRSEDIGLPKQRNEPEKNGACKERCGPHYGSSKCISSLQQDHKQDEGQQDGGNFREKRKEKTQDAQDPKAPILFFSRVQQSHNRKQCKTCCEQILSCADPDDGFGVEGVDSEKEPPKYCNPPGSRSEGSVTLASDEVMQKSSYKETVHYVKNEIRQSIPNRIHTTDQMIESVTQERDWDVQFRIEARENFSEGLKGQTDEMLIVDGRKAKPQASTECEQCKSNHACGKNQVPAVGSNADRDACMIAAASSFLSV